MGFQTIPMKVKIRKIGRSLYALIPNRVVKDLELSEGQEATVLVNFDDKTFAYSVSDNT